MATSVPGHHGSRGKVGHGHVADTGRRAPPFAPPRPRVGRPRRVRGGDGDASPSSSPSPPSPSPGCAPTTTNVIRAVSLSFDRDCMAVPAGSPSTIDFANDDAGESHNVAMYPADSCLGKAVAADEEPRCQDPTGPAAYRGSVILGVERITYDVPALAARRLRLRLRGPPVHARRVPREVKTVPAPERTACSRRSWRRWERYRA